jgi:hypothetical protein
VQGWRGYGWAESNLEEADSFAKVGLFMSGRKKMDLLYVMITLNVDFH